MSEFMIVHGVRVVVSGKKIRDRITELTSHETYKQIVNDSNKQKVFFGCHETSGELSFVVGKELHKTQKTPSKPKTLNTRIPDEFYDACELARELRILIGAVWGDVEVRNESGTILSPVILPSFPIME